MPRIAYIDKAFRPEALAVIDKAVDILEEYLAQGLSMTLRQLYYQFVARDLIENSQRSYKRLGNIISDARLAGLIDWDHLVDRGRNLISNSHWSSPQDVINAAASGYARDLWDGQDYRVEVWVEKEALIGVVEDVASEWDVPCFACKGYTSQSEMWGAGQRLLSYIHDGQDPVIIHLGDHDPSGIDMTRDIEDRLRLFCEEPVRIHRIALNRDQIDQYDPPPNPAKVTDSRAATYIAEHGTSSWELDALEPSVLRDLIEETILDHLDRSLYDELVEEVDREKGLLRKAARKWNDIVEFLEKK